MGTIRSIIDMAKMPQSWLGCCGLICFGLLVAFKSEFSVLAWPLMVLAVASTPFANRTKPRRFASFIAILSGLLCTYLLTVQYRGLPLDRAIAGFWGALSVGSYVAGCLHWGLAGRFAKSLPLLGLISTIALFFAQVETLGNRHEVWMAVISGLGLILTSESISSGPWGMGYKLNQRLVIGVVLFMMVIGVSRFIKSGIDQAIPEIHNMLDSTIEGIELRTVITRRTFFPKTSTLQSMSSIASQDPDFVAISVYGPTRPGYLRGAVNSDYSRGIWSNGDSRSIRKRIPREGVSDGISTIPSGGSQFRLRPPVPGKLYQFEMVREQLLGDTVFAPNDTQRLTVDSDLIEVDQHFCVVRGARADQPYSFVVSSGSTVAPLEGFLRNDLLEVPVSIRSDLEQFARREFNPDLGPKLYAAQLESFFQANYRYSLVVDSRPSALDPVLSFLESRHPANCEYFASAACLLLRTQGIPARFVTGFVVTERDESDDRHWLGRYRDAHAWVEAFDERDGRWFIVEATPGRDPIPIDFDAAIAQSLDASSDSNGGESQKSDDDWENGLWKAIQGLLFSERTLWCLAVSGFAFLALNRVRNAFTSTIDRQVRTLDRTCRRRGMIRHRSIPLATFADSIENHETLAPLASKYRSASDRLYGSPFPR